MGFQYHQTMQKPVTVDYKVPDFYPNFSCKGTSCKENCCKKWRVTISMSEYFILHGLNCSKKLKSKIDRSLRLLEPRTKERYAEIIKDHEGKCPLLLENGYCQLHSELGEKVLPSVCRYFPRGPRGTYFPSLSTSNGCERTLELLFINDEPINFIWHKQSFFLPAVKSNKSLEEIKEFERIQTSCFQSLSNRIYSISERIYQLGLILKAETLNNQTEILNFEEKKLTDTFDFNQTINVLFKLSDFYIENNPSMALFCSKAKEVFNTSNSYQTYQSLKQKFENKFSNHEVLFEKMLINNLFFKQFPDQEHTVNYLDEYISFSGLYIFLRYLVLASINDINNIDDFINLMTKLFRVIGHTRFERNMVIFLKNQGINSLEKTSFYLSF